MKPFRDDGEWRANDQVLPRGQETNRERLALFHHYSFFFLYLRFGLVISIARAASEWKEEEEKIGYLGQRGNYSTSATAICTSGLD